MPVSGRLGQCQTTNYMKKDRIAEAKEKFTNNSTDNKEKETVLTRHMLVERSV